MDKDTPLNERLAYAAGREEGRRIYRERLAALKAENEALRAELDKRPKPLNLHSIGGIRIVPREDMPENTRYVSTDLYERIRDA